MIQTQWAAKREPLKFSPNFQIVNASNSMLGAVAAAAVACDLAEAAAG